MALFPRRMEMRRRPLDERGRPRQPSALYKPLLSSVGGELGEGEVTPPRRVADRHSRDELALARGRSHPTTFQNATENRVEKGLGDNETWNCQQNEVEVHLRTLWADVAGVRQARGLACTKPRSPTEDTHDFQAPQGCPGQPRDGQLVPRQSAQYLATEEGKATRRAAGTSS